MAIVMTLTKAGGLPRTPPRTSARRRAEEEEGGAVWGADYGNLPKMVLHRVLKLDDGPGVKGRNYQQGRKTEIVGGEAHAGARPRCVGGWRQ